ncbi:MAG: asparaginase [Pseudodonghicola sp.]|nr:asparaginase [Pseudodonghicola sp.]
MPHVTMITTGGTIASRRVHETGHVVASVSAEDLRATLRDPLDGIPLQVEEFCKVGSYAIDLPMVFSLANRINTVLADTDCLGVVVTHGTDTLEESCFLVDLLLISDKPVVFTGAQRDADAPDTDGPRNIADSIRLAAAPQARGLGAMICFEQEFHAARDVSKTHSSRTDTFHSYEHGKLGEIDGTEVRLHRRPLLRRSYAPARIEPAIEMVTMVMGSDGWILSQARAAGAKAVVVQGFGRGNTPPGVTRAATDLVAAGVPVVMTSRSPRGRVRPIYGNGGGKTLSEVGVIFAGDLSGPKARILLAVLLGMGLSGEALRQEIEFMAG